MKQKIVIALVLSLCVTCQLVGTRSAAGGVTAYLNRTTWVYARPSTSATKTRVAKGTKVMVTATHGSWARIQKGKAKGYIQKKYLSSRPSTTPIPRPTPRPTATPRPSPRPSATPRPTGTVPSWRRQVEKLDWFKGGSSILKRGGYAHLYDIDTGIIIRIHRLGGTNHADVEPATASDTAKLRRIAGGTFSWRSHAVVLIKGGRYIAAAINTMPHGEQTIKDNDFPGQFCLHMAGSLTHGSGVVNAEHQASIERVLRWAKK